jgi:hypothetical protein
MRLRRIKRYLPCMGFTAVVAYAPFLDTPPWFMAALVILLGVAALVEQIAADDYRELAKEAIAALPPGAVRTNP